MAGFGFQQWKTAKVPKKNKTQSGVMVYSSGVAAAYNELQHEMIIWYN